MDDATVAPDSPQEDEFALLLMGLPSLYRGFLDPRRLPDLMSLLRGDDADEWVPAFLEFAGAIVANRPGRLVVKSPNHLFRLESIRRNFSNSPLLVTLRDPAETWFSNVRMWKSMIDIYGHWPARDGVVEEFVTAAVERAATQLNNLADMQASGVAIAALHFEELAANPVEAIASVLPVLGLQYDGDRLKARAARVAATPRTRVETLPETAQAAVQRLSVAQGRFSLSSGNLPAPITA